ncbi:MAG: hypothetical protein ABSE72_12185, partial [Bacteroidales bacterium]
SRTAVSWCLVLRTGLLFQELSDELSPGIGRVRVGRGEVVVLFGKIVDIGSRRPALVRRGDLTGKEKYQEK